MQANWIMFNGLNSYLDSSQLCTIHNTSVNAVTLVDYSGALSLHKLHSSLVSTGQNWILGDYVAFKRDTCDTFIY